MMPPAEIVGILLIAALVWLIWDSLRAREAAVAASRSACAERQFLFLDDTVAIESVRPVRDDDGWIRLRRIYGFEFSDTGDSRRRGTVVVVGATVILLDLAAMARNGGRTWH
jgi:hypothetical protein